MFNIILVFLLTFMVWLAPDSHHTAWAQDRPARQEMEEVMAYVYQNNPSLYAAREELRSTEELYPQARAGWLPSVTGEASLYATDIDSSNFSSGDGATTKDLNLSVDQPIWRGGRTFAETDKAKALIRAGDATLRQAEQDTLYNVAEAYMNVLRDRQLFVAYRRNEELLRRELDMAQDRHRMGDLTTTDVEQTKARYAKAQSLRIQAARELYVSDAEYEQLVGMRVPAEMLIPIAALDMPEDPALLVDMAQDMNAELQSYIYKQKASEHNADALFRELLPQVSAFASVDKQYDPQPGIIPDSQVETIGIKASIDLFRGGATRSRVRQAKADAKRQAYAIDDIKRRIKEEVLSSWRSYNAAKQQREAVKAEITATRNALQGVREEARLGQRTIQDILDADEDVIEAEVKLARAQHEEIVSKYALARNVGIPLLAGADVLMTSYTDLE